MVVLLALMLNELSISRQRIEAQDAKATLLLERVSPVLDQADPVLRASDEVLRDVEQATPGLRDAAASLRPLSHSIATGVERAVPVLDQLARSDVSGTAAAVVDLAQAAAPVLRRLDPRSFQETAERLSSLLSELPPHRVGRLARDGGKLAGKARRRDLVRRLDRATHDIGQVLEVQRAARRLQSNSVQIQRRSLEIQQETLEHVASLDRKTGGQAVP